MFVSEDEWFRAFVYTYVRNYVLYKSKTVHPFLNLTVAEVQIHMFWAGRDQWRLKDLPSQRVSKAIGFILHGLQKLKLNVTDDGKFDQLDKLADELLKSTEEGADLAAKTLLRVIS